MTSQVCGVGEGGGPEAGGRRAEAGGGIFGSRIFGFSEGGGRWTGGPEGGGPEAGDRVPEDGGRGLGGGGPAYAKASEGIVGRDFNRSTSVAGVYGGLESSRRSRRVGQRGCFLHPCCLANFRLALWGAAGCLHFLLRDMIALLATQFEGKSRSGSFGFSIAEQCVWSAF